jgi:hypothetical protein
MKKRFAPGAGILIPTAALFLKMMIVRHLEIEFFEGMAKMPGLKSLATDEG